MSPRQSIRHVLVLAAAASTLFAGPAPAQEEAPRKKVLLIGLDGVRVDIMAAVETPVIDSLAAAGFFSDEARTRVRTMSGPGWSSMLTGARTDKQRLHGQRLPGLSRLPHPDRA